MNQNERDLLKLYEDMIKEPSKSTNKDVCSDCQIGLITIYDQSIKSCPNCGLSEQILVQTFDKTDLDRCRFKRYTKYKRSLHLRNVLKLITCRKNIGALDRLLLQIREYIKVLNIDEKDISKSLIRNILRRSKLAKFYRYTNTIYVNITHEKPHYLSDQELKKIADMFKKIEDAYQHLKPNHRKSFLSYNFVLNKMLHRIDRSDLAFQLPSFKLNKNIRFHNNIWSKIEKLL